MKRLIWVMIPLFFSVSECLAQKVALKTDFLYGVCASAPNLGIEVGVSPRGTLDLGAGFNWFVPRQPYFGSKLVHWLGTAEYRYWTCERFNGHFFGVHAIGTQYNIAGHNLRMLFGEGSQAYRYEGWGAGLGLSYGYQFFLGPRWSLEATIGLGYVRLDYDRFECTECGAGMGVGSRNYFGPTKAGITLVFLIK